MSRAFTPTGYAMYPPYLNVREEGDEVVVTVRGEPKVYENASYICGFASDAGQPGRCTPGDEFCNNYCNMAPQKGKMQDHPKRCTQYQEGSTAIMRLPKAEWQKIVAN